MPRFHLLMLKLVRLSGWLLLVAMAVQFSTVSIFVGLVPAAWMHYKAMQVHKLMAIPIFVFLLLHVVPAVYLAVRRWTWRSRHLQT